MRKLTTVLALAIVPLAQVISCGDGTTSGLPTVLYGGTATDEAFEQVWDRISRTTISNRGAVVSSPMGGTMLPADPAPKITWTLPVSSRSAPEAGALRWAARRAAPGVFGVASAWAHGTPTTGNVFLLELRTSANAEPIRVFTTLMEWQVDEASWRTLKGARAPVTITIWNAYLNQNLIEEGPFSTGNTVSFSISET